MTTAKTAHRVAGPPAAVVDGQGQRRYRTVALVLVSVEGRAESAATFDEAAGRVNPDLWEPLEIAATEVQVACDDGQWHPVLESLWGETVGPERRGEVASERDDQPLLRVGAFAELTPMGAE